MPKITKRQNGLYERKLEIGRDDNGKRIRKTIYARSQRELEEKYVAIKAQISNGVKPITSKLTLSEYSTHWFNIYKSNKSINTKAMYNNIIRIVSCNPSGSIPINKVTRSDLQSIINDNISHPRICSQLKMTLLQVLDSAIEDGLVIKNIALKLELPKAQSSSKRALTETERKAVLSAQLPDRERLFLTIIYYLGVRRQEALALTKSSFNWDNSTVYISNAIAFNKNTPVYGDTKNKTSKREIPIPLPAVDIIKNYVEGLETEYLFTMKNREPMSQSSYTKMWHKICTAINIELCTEDELNSGIDKTKNLTAHIFRHNYATMLYYSNISIIEAVRLLGHSDSKMIMEVYAHLDEKKENSKDKLDAIFSQ